MILKNYPIKKKNHPNWMPCDQVTISKSLACDLAFDLANPIFGGYLVLYICNSKNNPHQVK